MKVKMKSPSEMKLHVIGIFMQYQEKWVKCDVNNYPIDMLGKEYECCESAFGNWMIVSKGPYVNYTIEYIHGYSDEHSLPEELFKI